MINNHTVQIHEMVKGAAAALCKQENILLIIREKMDKNNETSASFITLSKVKKNETQY